MNFKRDSTLTMSSDLYIFLSNHITRRESLCSHRIVLEDFAAAEIFRKPQGSCTSDGYNKVSKYC